MKRCLLTMVLLFSYQILSAQDRKLTLNLNNQSIHSFFKEIENKCGYTFVYSNEVISDSMTVSLNVVRMPVAQVLANILPEKKLAYRMVSDRLIAIGSKKQSEGENISQSKTSFNGVIVDQTGKGIPFASVSLFESSTLVTGTISTEIGNYQLSHSFEKQHAYRLKVSSIGYEVLELNFIYPDTTALKRVVMTEDRQTLKAVSVISEKPLVERRTDRFIVNVEGSFLEVGNNGLEVLQKSPGIWVSGDGSIKIKGNQSVMVMINNVVQRMSEGDLAEYLRTLRSEDIAKIEIISSPPSEFEAAGSGGIIHIVLKKTRKDGLVGLMSSQYRQQENRPAWSSGISLNYKLKSLYLSGNISGGKEESDYIASTKINYPNEDFYASNTDRYNNNGRLMYRVSAAYDLGRNQSLSFQSVQNESKMNQYFDTYISFQGGQPLTGQARSEWFRKPSLHSSTLNYLLKTDSLGSELKMIADYVYSTRTELNNFSSVYSFTPKNSTYRNNTPNKTNLYSLQTDYTKVFGEALSFKTGLKFVATKRDNEVLNENLIEGTWQINPKLSNRFIYNEKLSMAYASLEKTWGKLSAKVGLRAEYTDMEGNSLTENSKFNRDYLGLFPSLFVNQKLNEKNGSALYLSYSRRLQRPGFADLNPYRLQFDDYLTQLGNPALTPEYMHKLEVGTVFWKGFSADIYYALTLDKIAQLANPVGNVIEYQTRNFSNSKEYGFSFNAPLKIFKWWTTNTSLAGYNLSYNLTNYRISQTTFYARSYHVFTLKNFLDLDAGLDYRSPFVRANTKIAYQLYTDFGASKKLLNKSLTIRFYVADLLNTAREKDFTEFGDTRIDFYQKRPTRNFSLSVSYNFSSGKKFNAKKIEQSNDEEKRRIGN
ncbi:outer membrane beta-barrel protein [Pedobacter insulae]|uniref:Outer membrane receptor proteins, mostly Fe transport n=1 Tax=Pedobacter insulae TaxID=414048 RepID=A0A1I2ZR42_9SPHI|nr:outer membrane beta-barrel protein [Pedobacter insulae]SFH40066.1 Outer membrane receptor proteins, mostly Fe transport [Pedobacter insulae]